MTPDSLFERWYVRPIEKLKELPDGDGRFAALMIALPLCNGIEAHLRGSKTRSSADALTIPEIGGQGWRVRSQVAPRAVVESACRSRVHGFGRSDAFFVALLLFLAASVLQACGGSSDEGEPVIELGALVNMSATGDPDSQAAIRLAVEDVNAFFAGGGAGDGQGPPPRVRVTVEGTGLDPAVASEKIELLAARGLKVVIGPESSAEVETIKPFTDANDLVLLSHCSTAPSLAIPDDSVYRLVPSDLRQAEAIARLIDANGYRAIVPMWRAGVWGDDVSSAASPPFVALGGTVYPGVRFDPEADDFSRDLAALNEQVAEARAGFGDAVAVAFFSFGP